MSVQRGDEGGSSEELGVARFSADFDRAWRQLHWLKARRAAVADRETSFSTNRLLQLQRVVH